MCVYVCVFVCVCVRVCLCVCMCVFIFKQPQNSLCKLVQWLVKDWREKSLKKEQSATSKLSSTLRKERSERSHIPHEMSHLLLKHAESSPAEQPKPQPSQPQPSQPPRRVSPANLEINDFICRENLSKATEVQLIKNGFNTLNAILCLREADLESLELQFADLCLLRESLTRLRDHSGRKFILLVCLNEPQQ